MHASLSAPTELWLAMVSDYTAGVALFDSFEVIALTELSVARTNATLASSAGAAPLPPRTKDAIVVSNHGVVNGRCADDLPRSSVRLCPAGCAASAGTKALWTRGPIDRLRTRGSKICTSARVGMRRHVCRHARRRVCRHVYR